MSHSNLRVLVRALRKKDRRETLDNIRDSATVRAREARAQGNIRPDKNYRTGDKRDGKVIPS